MHITNRIDKTTLKFENSSRITISGLNADAGSWISPNAPTLKHTFLGLQLQIVFTD